MKIIIAILCGILLGVLLSDPIDQVVSPLFAEPDPSAISEYDPTGQEMYWEEVEIIRPTKWKEIIESRERVFFVHRSLVPGGWLICYESGLSVGLSGSITFYPDPEHKWQPAVNEGAPWRK